MDLKFTRIGKSQIDLLRDMCIETFRETYESMNDPVEFQDYIKSAFNKEKLLSEIDNPNSYYYFVLQIRQPIGYFKLNIEDAQTESMSSEYAELERIYLYKSQHGNGYGASMIIHCESVARDLGATKLWLGVWEKNENAVQFYQKMGFSIFGEHFFVIGTDHQKDFMMEKLL